MKILHCKHILTPIYKECSAVKPDIDATRTSQPWGNWIFNPVETIFRPLADTIELTTLFKSNSAVSDHPLVEACASDEILENLKSDDVEYGSVRVYDNYKEWND